MRLTLRPHISRKKLLNTFPGDPSMILASPVIRSFETFSGGFEYEKTIPLLFVTAENADAELVVNQSSLQAPVSLSLSF